MKIKLLNLFFILTVVFQISCSSDDDGTASETDAELAGEWEMISYNYVGSTSAESFGIPIKIDYTGEATEIDVSITIDEDPNIMTAMGSYTIKLTTNVGGQSSTQSYPFEDIATTSTFEREGDELIVETSLFNSSQGLELGTEVLEAPLVIEELTEDSLILTSKVQQTVEQEGVEFTVKLDIEQEYIRK